MMAKHIMSGITESMGFIIQENCTIHSLRKRRETIDSNNRPSSPDEIKFSNMKFRVSLKRETFQWLPDRRLSNFYANHRLYN